MRKKYFSWDSMIGGEFENQGSTGTKVQIEKHADYMMDIAKK